MKSSPNERLSEQLLNVDQEILVKAYEIDDAKKLKEYIKLNSKEAKKPFYITTTFKRATAIAACLAIVAVTAFALTKKPDNNISSNNETSSGNKDTNSNNVSSNSGETSSENKKVIYVTGDTPDQSIADGDSIKSLKVKYISQKLKEKMDLYKDYKDAEVMYHVIIKVFIAQEDYTKASELAITNKEVQSLLNQLEVAMAEERKAKSELSVFNGLNKGNDPETVEKRKKLIAIRDEKEKNRIDLWRQYANLSHEIQDEYLNEVLEERLEFLKQFSEQELATTLYNSYVHYIIDLTAEEINILVEKGGYSFRLSNEKPPIASPD